MLQCQVLTKEDQKRLLNAVHGLNQIPKEIEHIASLILAVDLMIVEKVNQAYKFLEASGAIKVCGAKPYVQNKKS